MPTGDREIFRLHGRTVANSMILLLGKPFRFAENTPNMTATPRARLAAGRRLRHDRGNRNQGASNAPCRPGGFS
jgi:hypothetical protein